MKNEMKNELINRLSQFAKDVITTIKPLGQPTHLNQNVIEQILKSGTSIGITYVEGSGGLTRKAFSFKMNLCRSQCQETVYRLELLLETGISKKIEVEKLLAEAKELLLIFNKITWKIRENDKNSENNKDAAASEEE